jgi:hypothetical protein
MDIEHHSYSCAEKRVQECSECHGASRTQYNSSIVMVRISRMIFPVIRHCCFLATLERFLGRRQSNLPPMSGPLARG